MIELKRYDTVLEHGRPVTYAITKTNKKILMPDAFSSMYNDDYLAIEQTRSECPEVLGVPDGAYYIPLYTGVTANE